MTDDFSIDHHSLMPWKVMGEDMDVIKFEHLEGLSVKTKSGTGRHTGIIVDWKDGYSRYQEEHKPLNLVALSKGQFALQPNNYCFLKIVILLTVQKEQTKLYKRGEDIYWE